MAHHTLSALKTQKTMAAATRADYFSNFTKTESQFKISFLNFFHFSYSYHSLPSFNSTLFLSQSFHNQDCQSSHDEPIWLLLLAEFWRLLHSDSRQAGTSALCAGQRKARQPWWKGRSSARRHCCQFTPPQPGKGGEAGRGRGEQ